MDIHHAYSVGTAAWLALQAIPLILAPSFIIAIMSQQMHDASPTETYLARSLGFTLLLASLLNLVLSGTFSFAPSRSEKSSSTTEGAANPQSPYARSTVILTTAYHSITAFYASASYTRTGVFSYALGLVGSGSLAVFGLWIILFGSGSHISRRTGADKRTAGFPFKNTVADKRKAR